MDTKTNHIKSNQEDCMTKKSIAETEKSVLTKVVSIDEAKIKSHLDEIVWKSVEEILNSFLSAEADAICKAERYKRNPERIDTRAGHYTRGLFTKVGKVKLNIPRLRSLPYVSILVAVGVNQDGFREFLCVCEGAKEDKESWLNFIRHLKERGLNGAELIISDKCIGLVEALGETFPNAKWQRCIVHWYRNIFSIVPRRECKEVSAMLKAIHAQEDKNAALHKAEEVAKKLEEMHLKKVADKIREDVMETLQYMDFPREHWIRSRTNNPMERIMREIRRRTRVVGNFPDGESALILVSARLKYITSRKWGTQMYLDMRRLTEFQLEEATA